MIFLKGLYLSALFIFLMCIIAPGNILAADKKIPTIEPKNLSQMMREQKSKIVLVNTMSTIECDDHSIAGSLCIPVEIMKDRVKTLPGDKFIVFYCETETGVRCLKAAQIARENGRENVAVLAGGAVGWRKAGFNEISRKRIPRQIIRSIPAETLKEWIDKKHFATIVDIRSPESFANGHIDGAVNISFHILNNKYSGIPKGKTIVVVDDKGLRSFLAASYLRSLGFESVVRLGGGMEAWQEAYAKR